MTIMSRTLTSLYQNNPTEFTILLNNRKITNRFMEASAKHVPGNGGHRPAGEAFSDNRKEVRAWFQARYYRKRSTSCGLSPAKGGFPPPRSPSPSTPGRCCTPITNRACSTPSRRNWNAWLQQGWTIAWCWISPSSCLSCRRGSSSRIYWRIASG